MIADPLHSHDDMRRQCLDEGAFEKSDHRRDDRSARRRAKVKVARLFWNLAFGIWIFLFGAPLRAEEAWRVWLEPKLMRPPVANPVEGSERTLLAAGRRDGDGLVTFGVAEFAALKITWADFFAEAQRNAVADLATLTPRYVRNRRKVIEYAVLESARPIVASAVLAPQLLALFADTLGEKVLLVVPNRSTAFAFPALAGNHRDYWPMVFAAFRATPYPVSVEVFELSATGLRAVGVYEEP